MSTRIIAVEGIPVKCTLIQTVKILAKTINGQFEALYFNNPKGVKGIKTCYIRLSKDLDPLQVVEKINTATAKKVAKFTAIIPEHIPKLPPGINIKPKRIPMKMQRSLKLYTGLSEKKLLEITNQEILIEMQSKYTKLYNLSKKTGHKLLENIARTVFERLKIIMKTNYQASRSGFVLTKVYRVIHPHIGDFQLILSTLHAIQDAAGEPRQQINKDDLIATNIEPYVIDNVRYTEVQASSNKYADRIIQKVTQHINNFKTEINHETDAEGDIARKKVREKLKKLTPYLQSIVTQVISRNLLPSKPPHHKIRAYGEPFMPNKEAMRGVLDKHGAQAIKRFDCMYNLLKFSVPPNSFASIIAMDGAVIGGAKLVIRSSDIPIYKVPKSVKDEMTAASGASQGPESRVMDVENNDKWFEEW